MATSLSATLFAFWRRLAPLPGGRWLFSKVVGRLAPYSGSMGARVETLEPGHAVVTLRDRRAVRNHLESIHAVALLNLGELASGLATLVRLPEGWRGIVVHLEADYRKKARGPLVAESTVPPLEDAAEHERVAEAAIRDAGGETVAVVRARWRIGPVR